MIFEAIKKMVNSNHNKPLDILIAEKTQEIKDTLDGGMQVPVVKSVQRGLTTMNSKKVDITISEVNPNKTVVLVEAHMFYDSSGSSHTSTGYLVSGNCVRIFSDYAPTYSLAWQVIEFY